MRARTVLRSERHDLKSSACLKGEKQLKLGCLRAQVLLLRALGFENLVELLQWGDVFGKIVRVDDAVAREESG